MIHKSLLIASLLCVLTSAAMAQAHTSMTASQLADLCTSRYDVDVGMCAGYVTAVADKLMLRNDPRQPLCLSPAIGPQTLVDNILALWRTTPPEANSLAAVAVDQALSVRFRCP